MADDAQNAAPEERSTVADLRVLLDEKNVTLHLVGETSADHVTISLYGLAEGLAHDWWLIFGARDRAFSLLNYRTGYAVPDLRMSFDAALPDRSSSKNIQESRYPFLGRPD